MAAAEAHLVARTHRPGDRIAEKYVLERMTGAGGMCTVWIALHSGLDRKVALKFLRADLPQREAGRLLLEARATARLEHPSIVKVFDYGETREGLPFIVMELLDGMSLADSLDRSGPLGAVAACRLILPIIEGLSLAHDSGIVHRDLKPANIFLAREGGRIQPKLLDFGIAKFETGEVNPTLTLDGAVLGSPSYMAPEQARGQSDVDHRADVWAICMVLYEAVAGDTPIRGDNYNALLRSIVEDEIPPLRERSGDEAALWTILSRGLTKDRKRRFQSVHELGVALTAFLVDRGIETDVGGVALPRKWVDGEVTPRRELAFPLTTRSTGVVSTRDSPTTMEPASARVFHETRRRRAVLAVPFAAAVVAAAAALLLPVRVVDSLTGAGVVAAKLHRGAVELARAFGSGAGSPPAAASRAEVGHGIPRVAAAPNVVASASASAPRVVPVLAPPVRGDASAPRSVTRNLSHHKDKSIAEAAPSPPQHFPADVAGPSSERDKSEDALRALGLKAPYR